MSTNLVRLDYSFEVDTYELDERLGKIEEKLNDLGGEDILDEERVEQIVANLNFVERDDFDTMLQQSKDTINEMVRDLAHEYDVVTSDNLDEAISSYVGNNDLMDGSEVDQKITDAIENGGFATAEEMDEAISEKLRETGLGEAGIKGFVTDVDARFEGLDEENERLRNRITDLEKQVANDSLPERIETLEAEIEGYRDAQHQLEGKLAVLNHTISVLDASLKEQNERNRTAMTFFDLIKQAFALIQQR